MIEIVVFCREISSRSSCMNEPLVFSLIVVVDESYDESIDKYILYSIELFSVVMTYSLIDVTLFFEIRNSIEYSIHQLIRRRGKKDEN